MKRKFYAGENYGMGSIIQVIHARNEDEIYSKYPMLLVFEPSPEWLAAHITVQFREYDIDDPPDALMEPYTKVSSEPPYLQRRLLEPRDGAVRAFARKNGLSMLKYDRGANSWDLRFEHPRGGHGKLLLAALPSKNEIEVSGWWWGEDSILGRFRRAIPGSRMQADGSDDEFLEKLAERLSVVKAWPED
jgi:hypothetical protein